MPPSDVGRPTKRPPIFVAACALIACLALDLPILAALVVLGGAMGGLGVAIVGTVRGVALWGRFARGEQASRWVRTLRRRA